MHCLYCEVEDEEAFCVLGGYGKLTAKNGRPVVRGMSVSSCIKDRLSPYIPVSLTTVKR